HPAEVDREEEDQHRPLPEDRDGEAEERADADHVVHGAVPPHGGDDAGGDAEGEREPHGKERQLDGDREALEDEADDGLASAPRGAEITLGEVAEPAGILDPPGLVEAEEAPELRD